MFSIFNILLQISRNVWRYWLRIKITVFLTFLCEELKHCFTGEGRRRNQYSEKFQCLSTPTTSAYVLSWSLQEPEHCFLSHLEIIWLTEFTIKFVDSPPYPLQGPHVARVELKLFPQFVCSKYREFPGLLNQFPITFPFQAPQVGGFEWYQF